MITGCLQLLSNTSVLLFLSVFLALTIFVVVVVVLVLVLVLVLLLVVVLWWRLHGRMVAGHDPHQHPLG